MKLLYEFCLYSIKVKAFCIIKPIHLKLIPLFLLFSAFCSAAQSWTGSGFFKQNIDNKIEIICSDAFAALKDLHAAQKLFDVIILDPPAFIKRRKEN